MKLTEEQLRRAALLAREKELSLLPEAQACPAPVYSAQFEAHIQQLLTQIEQGIIKPKPVPMGWQYYAKRGVAAVLLCAILTCAAMPEAVMAGYEKLVQVIETIFEEFTEFRFSTTAYTKDEFVPVTLNYLPEGMQEITRRVSSSGNIHLRYESAQNYFNLEQTILTDTNDVMYLLDTEDAITETLATKNGEVTIINKNGLYQYMLLHNSNLLVGDTDLTYNELVIILEDMTFCIKDNA